jgi:hypothetical protein
MFVNIKKLKPCKFIKYTTLQLVLTKLNELVTNEHVQTKERKPLLVEFKDLQLVKFELVNHRLTHGIIKKIHVLVHYYHDMPI